jgi:uracil-DNA glycosylase
VATELSAELAELAADLRAAVECWSEAGLQHLPGAADEALVLPELQVAAPSGAQRENPAVAPRSPAAARPPRPQAPVGPRPAPVPAPSARPRRGDAGPKRGLETAPRPAPRVFRHERPDFGELLPGAAGLTAIQEVLGDCQRCGLCRARRTIVFGVGDPDADLVVCGEGPGPLDDRQGVPFVGPAGQMLDKMLQHVLGLKREQVYLVNVVKCRPPDNRAPLPEEIAACRPFLDAQLQVLRPKVILSLGRPATQTLLRTGRGIKSLRGIWQQLGDVPVMPTFHPAYLLRQDQDKRLTFADLKAVRLRYDELGGRR